MNTYPTNKSNTTKKLYSTQGKKKGIFIYENGKLIMKVNGSGITKYD